MRLDDLPAHLQSAAGAAREREKRSAERKMLGCCPCGAVLGEAVCPWCDLGYPMGLRHLMKPDPA